MVGEDRLQLDLHHSLNPRGPSISAEAVPVVVTFFNAVFDGSNFQRQVGPNAVVTLNQLLMASSSLSAANAINASTG